MRKIASHYWLRPDGTIGKFPVLVFNDQNVIEEIRERDVFKEEASLELVNGFLIPGFVDFIPDTLSGMEDDDLKRYLNRQLIDGTRLLGAPNEIVKKAKQLNFKGINIVEYPVDQSNEVVDLSAFAQIQSATDSIAHLMRMTVENAKLLGLGNSYGVLQVGAKPGLLAISNVDYNTFAIDGKSKLKIII
ncbi:hypothetical protein E9993_14120 [Labilibacter sediminis]|nr:hypothetical protein E9993_14120 [Labilibacter sediminis]